MGLQLPSGESNANCCHVFSCSSHAQLCSTLWMVCPLLRFRSDGVFRFSVILVVSNHMERRKWLILNHEYIFSNRLEIKGKWPSLFLLFLIPQPFITCLGLTCFLEVTDCSRDISICLCVSWGAYMTSCLGSLVLNIGINCQLQGDWKNFTLHSVTVSVITISRSKGGFVHSKVVDLCFPLYGHCIMYSFRMVAY